MPPFDARGSSDDLRNQPLVLVVLEDAAVLDGKALELSRVEIAAGNEERAVGARCHGGDDIVDVALDVDAGLALELLLPFLVHGAGPP